MRLFSIQINCKSCLESFRMIDYAEIAYDSFYRALKFGKLRITFNCPYCNCIFEDNKFAIKEIEKWLFE